MADPSSSPIRLGFLSELHINLRLPLMYPPSFHTHQFQLHHPPWPRQHPSGWASSQPNYPLSWTAGAAGIPSDSEALWGQLYMDEPPPERMDGAEASRAPSSKREISGGSRSSHLSQELDIKPVRLSSGPAESSESSRASSQASREKRKKREKRSQRTSTDRERRSSQESSRTSSAIVIAAATVAQSSESDASLEKSRTSTSRRRRIRSAGLAIGSPEVEKVAKERTRSNRDDSESHKEDSQSTGGELGSPIDDFRSQKVGNQSSDDKSESCSGESGSQKDEESEVLV
ncbi:hypothetical protein E3U43_001909 [Larimichthys crocea]|uniref:Uncharacterized protein n=1 Tax=Larimichthys crocea TaxID=215358 RepID=A0ACD3REQ6_LARCR|nr:hypothetical protein E3U43_001909 [Larimichthys crocea]